VNCSRLSLTEALRKAVETLGGMKVVGSMLRPDIHPVRADEWLSHCLNDGHAQKLSPTQIDFIFDRAAIIGAHDALQGWCRGRGSGYSATPTAPEVALAEAHARAIAAQHAAAESAHDLQTLIDNPRLLATMRAAGLKV
jgi:hypothetical protein